MVPRPVLAPGIIDPLRDMGTEGEETPSDSFFSTRGPFHRWESPFH